MTKKKAAPGTRLIDGPAGRPYQVPEDAKIGDGLAIKDGEPLHVGPRCVIGDNVTIFYFMEGGEELRIGDGAVLNCRTVGDHVTVGANTKVACHALGSGISIGDNCIIDCHLPDDTRVGNNVTLGQGTVVRSGVRIPSNWLIPEGGHILNPGPDGIPVVVTPIPRQMQCGVVVSSQQRFVVG